MRLDSGKGRSMICKGFQTWGWGPTIQTELKPREEIQFGIIDPFTPL